MVSMSGLNVSATPAATVNFTVNPTDTLESVSERLQESGVITNARVYDGAGWRHADSSFLDRGEHVKAGILRAAR